MRAVSVRRQCAPSVCAVSARRQCARMTPANICATCISARAQRERSTSDIWMTYRIYTSSPGIDDGGWLNFAI